MSTYAQRVPYADPVTKTHADELPCVICGKPGPKYPRERRCKVCAVTYANAWTERNPGRAQQVPDDVPCVTCGKPGPKYRRLRQCKECTKYNVLTNWYLRRYGLTREALEGLLIAQKYQCAICGRNIRKRHVVDHDHASGAVRGLLCRFCNSSLGHFGDSTEAIQKVLDYLQRGATIAA